MNKKLYVQHLLDNKIDKDLAWNIKIGKSNNDYTKNFIMPFRTQLSQCKTTEDLIKFCKTIDINHNEAFEESFCLRYGLKFTGKLNTKITIINHKTMIGQHWKIVDDFEYLKDKHCFRVNQSENEKICFNKESIYFVNKTFFIHNDDDALEAVKYWKELKNKIKIQELKSDFTNDNN